MATDAAGSRSHVEPAVPPAPQADAPAEGRHVAPRIPGYRIHAVIGRGATGVVYRATQLAVERQVALKILHPELVPDRRAVLRLQREARLAARLAHPCIISAIDMGELGGRWWYAMELVEGVSVLRRIAQKGPFTERECLRLFSPLCDALQHAHEVGVVHRDIKPANIQIDRRGRARLVDLGLAMSVGDPTLTRTGGTLGTPHYVSPEQARDPRCADTRSDLWSLGATMYHAVCGRPPFSGESVAEILSQVLNERVPDPREFAPDLSKGFALMLGKCLTRDPERRYQEPWELVADIELLRERRRPEVRASSVDAFKSRHPSWLRPALLTAGVAVLLAGTWVSAARPWETTAAPAPPSLEDWPELVRIRDAFEAGSLSHAAALAELASSSLNELPDEARLNKNGLEQRIKLDLHEIVRSLRSELDATFEERMSARDFVASRALVERDVDAELRGRTGFDGVAALPIGQTRLETADWQRDRTLRIEEARRAALAEAGTAIDALYPVTVRAAVAERIEERNWRAAFELLEVPALGEWVAASSPAVDLRGLDERELGTLVSRVNPLAQVDRALVERTARAALSDLSMFIENESERLTRELADSVDDDPSRRLRDAFEKKRAGEGIRFEQLPDGWGDNVLLRLERAAEKLGRDAERTRNDLALSALEDLEARADKLRAERRYEAEAELWEEFLGDAWRIATHPRMRIRLREAELLAGLLERATAGLLAADGEQVTLVDGDRIRREGELEVRAGVETSGFYLKHRGTRTRFWLRPGQRDEQERATQLVLGAEDVLHFAGVDAALARARAAPGNGRAGRSEPPAGATGEEAPSAASDAEAAERRALASESALAAALFLLAERRPLEAGFYLRLEQVAPADAALAAELDDRLRSEAANVRAVRAERDRDRDDRLAALRRTLNGSLGSASKLAELDLFLSNWRVELEPAVLAELEETRARLVTAPPEGSFDEIFGVPNLDRVGRQVRLRFDMSTERGRGRWLLGRWVPSTEGVTLRDPLLDDTRFLASDSGPHLALLSPLRTDRAITVRVTLRPDSSTSRGQLVALTIAGHHLLLFDGRGQPRAWFGTGDIRELTARAVQGGDVDDQVGFSMSPFGGLAQGRPAVIEVSFRPGTLERVLVDGKALSFYQKQFDVPVTPPSFLFVRSREAATLMTVELEGQRRSQRE